MFPENSARTPFPNDFGALNPSFCNVSVFDGFRTAFSRVSEHTSFALLKTRQHLLREQVEGMWKDLVRKGWKQVPAVWGPDAEP